MSGINKILTWITIGMAFGGGKKEEMGTKKGKGKEKEGVWGGKKEKMGTKKGKEKCPLSKWWEKKKEKCWEKKKRCEEEELLEEEGVCGGRKEKCPLGKWWEKKVEKSILGKWWEKKREECREEEKMEEVVEEKIAEVGEEREKWEEVEDLAEFEKCGCEACEEYICTHMELMKCLSILKNTTQEEERVEENKEKVEEERVEEKKEEEKEKKEEMERDVSVELERAEYRLKCGMEEVEKKLIEECRILMEEVGNLGNIDDYETEAVCKDCGHEEYSGGCVTM